MRAKNNKFDFNITVNDGGLAFSLSAAASFLTSMLFSVIVSIIAVAANKNVEAVTATDAVIIAAFALPSLGTFSVIAITAKKTKTNPLSFINNSQKKRGAAVWIATAMITFGVIFGLSEVNEYFVEFLISVGFKVTTATLPQKTALNVILTLLFVCVLPSILEETLFRGVITFGLRGGGEVFSVLLSATMFSLFHMQPSQTIYQFIFGSLFALIALRSNDVLPTIVSHFINNAFIVLNYYFFNITLTGVMKIIIPIAAIIILICGIILLLKTTKKEEKTEPVDVKRFALNSSLGFVICLLIWVTNLF